MIAVNWISKAKTHSIHDLAQFQSGINNKASCWSVFSKIRKLFSFYWREIYPAMLFAWHIYFYGSPCLHFQHFIAVLETKGSRNWQLIFMMFGLFRHRWKARLPDPHSASAILFQTVNKGRYNVRMIWDVSNENIIWQIIMGHVHLLANARQRYNIPRMVAQYQWEEL